MIFIGICKELISNKFSEKNNISLVFKIKYEIIKYLLYPNSYIFRRLN